MPGEILRILHVDTELTWRGGENQLRLLLEGLRRRAAAGGPAVANHVAVRPGSQAARRLRDLAQIVEVPMRGGFGLAATRQLRRYCREHEIQIIDAHTSNAHSYGLLTKLGVPDVKLVVHRRVDYRPGRSLMNRLKYKTAKVDRFVAISGAIKDILVDYGVAADRISIARSAVDGAPYRAFDRLAEKQALATAHGLDPGLVFIGNASAMTDQKAYDVLLRAAKILKDRGLRFHCFIAGDGPLLGRLEKLRADLVLDYDVTFLGFIERVPQFLSALDILTVPSNFEGLGTIILDGIHAGCCVAATAVGGIPEIITPEKTGLLSPKGDAAALAANVETLIGEPALRRKLAAAARAHVEKEFSLDAMVDGNLRVYREVLASRPPGK
jgi:glycosyltransferase involved in cell wall biosynthesis